MGGCFPCFGSSEKEGKIGVKEVVKKDSLKEGSAAQSHRVSRVNSGKTLFICQNAIFVYMFPFFRNFLGVCVFDWWLCFRYFEYFVCVFRVVF